MTGLLRFSRKNKGKTGFAIIEVILSMGIGLTLIFAFVNLVAQIQALNQSSKGAFKAVAYLREAIEAARDLEQSDWNALSPAACASVCHPAISAGAWSFVSGAETLEGLYNRSSTITAVYRDQATFPNKIVPASTPGAVLSTSTKKVSASVTWRSGSGVRTMTLETYLYKLQ